MSYSEHTRPRALRTRRAMAVVLASASMLGAVLGCQASAPASSPTASPVVPADGERPGRSAEARERSAGEPELVGPRGRPGGAVPRGVTVDDGVVPDGVTVFDDEFPAVAKLDPDLLSALRGAARAAADDGVAVVVNSGWRSREYQEQLFRDAVSEYGSAEEAALWVATPDTSAHVSGDAVDLGPIDATEWLVEHGAEYGLCRIYVNEPWHYELRSSAVEQGCPTPYADPTQDPRMQQ